MPAYPPPLHAPARPRSRVLRTGTTLFRVHSQRFEPAAFNPAPPPAGFGGGRFSSPGGVPACLYAASTARTAVAESLLRRLPFDNAGMRALSAVALQGRCLSELVLTTDLKVVVLHGDGLSRVGQDTWLVHSGAHGYPSTRAWGAAIRGWMPSVAGLEWRPRNDDDGLAFCLYEDRARGALSAVRSLAAWEGEGRAIVHASLLAFNVAPPLGELR